MALFSNQEEQGFGDLGEVVCNNGFFWENPRTLNIATINAPYLRFGKDLIQG